MTEPCYKELPIEELKQKSTIQLINLMRTMEFNYSSSDCDCYWNYCQCEKRCKGIRTLNIYNIYKILKTRPHIPNKKEARILRQQRAKKRFKAISAR